LTQIQQSDPAGLASTSGRPRPPIRSHARRSAIQPKAHERAPSTCRIAQSASSTPKTIRRAAQKPAQMQGLYEADRGTRTPGPFITSEERRFRMFAAGSLFACSRADLASIFRTAFAAVSGCSIAHSLPTSNPPASSGSRRRAAARGCRSWRLHVIAHAVARRACAPTQRRAARSRACGERCPDHPRRASRSSRPLPAPGARSGRLSWPRAPAPKPGQRPGRPTAAWIGRPALVAPRYLRSTALVDPRAVGAAHEPDWYDC
jgi:hypothetical protein